MEDLTLDWIQYWASAAVEVEKKRAGK